MAKEGKNTGEKAVAPSLGEVLTSIGIDHISCAICLEDHQYGVEIVKLNCKCKLGYCGKCIRKWMETKEGSTCAGCRAAILDTKDQNGLVIKKGVGFKIHTLTPPEAESYWSSKPDSDDSKASSSGTSSNSTAGTSFDSAK